MRYQTSAAIFAAVMALAGCRVDEAPRATSTQRASTSKTNVANGSGARASRHFRFGWGAGSRQLGLRPQLRERQANGVSAVAVGPRGRVFLLDRLNRRILRVSADGALERVAEVPEHATDFAVGGDGALVAYSPLRARVYLFVDGKRDGTLAVPRVFRNVRGVSLAASRRVRLHTALQESFELGSPRAAQTLGQVLTSKREGARLLTGGRGLQVRLVGGRAELLAVGRGGVGGRTRVLRRLVVARDARQPATGRTSRDAVGALLAARIVGVADGAACLRLERRGASAPGSKRFVVDREALCVDIASGHTRLRHALDRRGLYVPRRELAVGGQPARLAWIRPDQDGLTLQVWSLRGASR